jgi:formylglycine-generating enzyme required for sulfatase activity
MASALGKPRTIGLTLGMLLCVWVGCSEDAAPADGGPGTDLAADGSSDLLPPDLLPPCVHPQVVKQCTDGWCTIPAGCFLMGSPADETCRTSDEDQVRTTLSWSFEILATEVTQGQFYAALGYNPAYYKGCGVNCPVELVSWHEAAAYCNALSEGKSLPLCYECSDSGPTAKCKPRTGRSIYECGGYRLPTDAEWEYAYRAGTTTALYNGALTECTGSDPTADAVGWYDANAEKKVHPTAQKLANAWGLHDMAGNVWEWCHDELDRSRTVLAVTDPVGAEDGATHTVRGGCWNFYVRFMRAASHGSEKPSFKSIGLGFRCVRSMKKGP